jgi:hypothetical protein
MMPARPSSDTLGPIARTVRDAAIVLDVIAGYDPKDPVTAYSVVCLLYRAGRPGPEGTISAFLRFKPNDQRNKRRFCWLGHGSKPRYDRRAQDLMLVENFR